MFARLSHIIMHVLNGHAAFSTCPVVCSEEYYQGFKNKESKDDAREQRLSVKT